MTIYIREPKNTWRRELPRGFVPASAAHSRGFLDNLIPRGNITLTATSGTISTGLLDTSIDNGLGNAGRITLNATGGITNAGAVAFGVNGSGGDISVTTTSLGDITTGSLTTLSNTTVAGSRAGNISVTTSEGSIVTGAIDSRASNAGPGGAVTVRSNFGAVTIGSLASSSGFGAAGRVDLRTFGGELRVNGLIDASSSFGTAGAVVLNNEAGGIATADIVAGSVEANSFSGLPFSFGNITAASSISLTTQNDDTTTGNLSATTGNVTVTSNVNGSVTTGNVTAGSIVNLQAGIDGTVTAGNVTAGTQVNASTRPGGNLVLGAITVGPGAAGDSIVLTSDGLNFVGGAGSVQAPGRLLIRTADSTVGIAVGTPGDTGPANLDLATTDLAALANGFSEIVLGNGSTIGPITLGSDVTFSDPVILRSRSLDTTGGSLSGIDNASLTLRADAGITTGPLSTQGQPVSVEADFNGDGIGAATITQSITSNGDAISITGSTPTGIGVYITNPGSLNSGGGEITATGNSFGPSTLPSRGIELDGTVNSQGGAITLTGTGVDEGITTFRSVSSGGGTITMNGSSSGTGTFARGVALVGPVNSTGGLISLSGTGANAGVSNFPSGTIDAGTGSVELLADNPLILAPVLGGDTLSIQNFDSTLPITLGGTDDPAIIFLNQDELAQLGNGFASRTIGQPGNTGAITLGSFTLNSPLTLSGGVLTGPNQNTTWQIDTDGSLVLGGFGAPLRLTNPTEIIGGDDAINTVLGSSGNDTFTLTGPSDGVLGSVFFRNISAFDGGAGLDTLVGTSADETYTITGSTSGTAAAISFINVEALATGGGQDRVDLASGIPLNLDLTGGDGTLTLQSAGGITLNTDVTTPGNLVIAAGSGDIVQSGGRVAAAGATVLGATGNISLGGNNDFSTVDVTSSESVFLNDTNNLQLNSLGISSDLQANAGGDLTATTNILVGGAPLLGPGLSADSLAGVRLTSGGNLTTADITAPGALIALQAGGAITSGNLDSSGVTGGVVSLQAGDRIQVNTINAQGTSQGGSIAAITGQTFQAFGTFFDQGEVAASLSTLGLTQGGPITLAYGGFTFAVGNPSLNGTAGAITTGDVALLPGQERSFVGSRIVGRGQFGEVQFISVGVPPKWKSPH
ncbi:MAG: hypothetical protein HC929_16445 [Leptolyngbyaceae cyanobacterium SM2_5_2]|nr:hypothetical protein [Leptolyngbyaceae cyanobacterium SM2_5_2]